MSGDGTAKRVGLVATRYAVPGVGVAAVVGARLMLERWIRLEAPFLLFLMTVVAAAWYGGWGPGLAAVGLAAAASAYFFLEPIRAFAVAAGADRVRLALFVLEGLVTCALCASLHAAKRRAEAEAERSRRLEGAVLEISDAEQRRIGQDLHDGLGQHLTGVAFLAKALEKRVGESSPEAAGDASRVARLVNEAVGRARDVARGLSPVDLETEGLQPALEHLAAGASAMFGIECKVGWEDGVAVEDRAVAMHVYRIAQEAISNALKHGRAGRVEVTVARGVGAEAGLAALAVSDNGIGIAEDEGPTGGNGGDGMGMRIMAYRARMIGGRLVVARGRRGGTAVRCAFPVVATATRAERPA